MGNIGMALTTPTGYNSSDLVFQEDFNGTTLGSTWLNYITSNAAQGAPWNSNGSGGSGPGGQYDADYHMPSQVTVSNGTLNLTAIKQPITGNNQGTTQTFPITSGAASSYGNFEFTGGYLQISMKAAAQGCVGPDAGEADPERGCLGKLVLYSGRMMQAPFYTSTMSEIILRGSCFSPRSAFCSLMMGSEGKGGAI
jgi:hypothetical protein